MGSGGVCPEYAIANDDGSLQCAAQEVQEVQAVQIDRRQVPYQVSIERANALFA